MKTKWQTILSYGVQFVVLISAFALEVYKGNTEAAIWVAVSFLFMASGIVADQLIQIQREIIQSLDKLVFNRLERISQSIDRARNKV